MDTFRRLDKMRLVIWAVGITILITFTVLDFLPLLSEYRYRNVDTQISVIKNGGVTRPNITACVPYHSGALARIVDWINQDVGNRSRGNRSIDLLSGAPVTDQSADLSEDQLLVNRSADQYQYANQSTRDQFVDHADGRSAKNRLINQLEDTVNINHQIEINQIKDSAANNQSINQEEISPLINPVIDQYDNRSVINQSFGRCFECDAMANKSWDVWSKLHHDPENPIDQNRLAVAILKKLLITENFTQFLEISPSNFNWNEAILDAIWRFFMCMAHRDMNYSTKSWTVYSKNSCVTFNLTAFDWIPKKTVDLLLDSVWNYVDKFFKIEIDDGFQVRKDNIKSRMHFLAIKGDYFCFAMRPTSVREIYTYSPFPDTDQAPWHRSIIPNYFAVLEDATILHSQPGDAQGVIYPSYARFHTQAYSESVLLIHEIANRVIDTRSGRSCTNDDLPFLVCLAKRQTQEIVQNCGCVPFLHRFIEGGYGHLPFCTSSKYKKCSTQIDKTYQINRAKCKDMCDYIFYKWQYFSSVDSLIDRSELRFQINITARSTPFVEFTLTVKDSPEKFLAQLGGLVNLYLGCSGMSLCAFIIMCIDLIRRRCRRKKPGNGSNFDPPVHFSPFQHRIQIGEPERSDCRCRSGCKRDHEVIRAEMKEAIRAGFKELRQELIGLMRRPR